MGGTEQSDEDKMMAFIAPGVAESPMFVFGSGQNSDKIETAVIGRDLHSSTSQLDLITFCRLHSSTFGST